MINKLMTATAIVLVSGGLAIAQTTSGDTSAAASGSAASTFQWDQTSQGAFFTDGALKSDTEVRAAFDALDAEKQAQLRSDCQTFASASGIGTGTGAAAGDTASSGTAGTTGGATTGTDTAAGSATTGTDSTATSSTTAGSDASSSAMPEMASMEQLCAKVQTY